MTVRLNGFEQFMIHFRELKRAAGTPQRLVSFHKDAPEISAAMKRLQYDFLLRFDFERRVDADKKLFRQVPEGFAEDWAEYKEHWAPAIAHLDLLDFIPELSAPYDPNRRPEPAEREAPDPDIASSFYPLWHDGGAAFRVGIGYLEHVFEFRKDSGFEDDEPIANTCRIALDAYDYLTKTIGIDISDVFRRWQSLPPIFMPAWVSNKHGNDVGSLNDLLNDAIRAYVCGAPAAALALCRPVVEMLLKKHYLTSEEYRDPTRPKRDKPLKTLVALAEKRFVSWRNERLYPRIRRVNNLLHDYSRMAPLDPRDGQFILDFIVSLKRLTEKVPQAS